MSYSKRHLPFLTSWLQLRLAEVPFGSVALGVEFDERRCAGAYSGQRQWLTGVGRCFRHDAVSAVTNWSYAPQLLWCSAERRNGLDISVGSCRQYAIGASNHDLEVLDRRHILLRCQRQSYSAGHLAGSSPVVYTRLAGTQPQRFPRAFAHGLSLFVLGMVHQGLIRAEFDSVATYIAFSLPHFLILTAALPRSCLALRARYGVLVTYRSRTPEPDREPYTSLDTTILVLLAQIVKTRNNNAAAVITSDAPKRYGIENL